ncbi:MAG: anthranilate phosphoribosyltransferase, partial [Actinobacteria bacterium]
EVARRVFAGERGPVRDAVVLNAGAAIAAQQGIGDDLPAAIAAGMARAAEAIDSGAAARALDRWVEVARAARDAE